MQTTKSKLSSRLKKIAWIVFIFTCTLLAALYMFQEKLIFQPTSLKADYAFKFNQSFEEFTIPTTDGEQLNALVFSPADSSKGLIFYFHGNAGNLQRWGQYAIDFTKLGYTVLMIDYRGYGKSTGTPGEKEFYQDASTVLTWAQQQLTFTKLIFYGRSLGAAVASQLATQHTPNLLILETPFDELAGVVNPPMQAMLSWIPLRYQFPNKLHLPQIACPKIIFHGTNDWVVPLRSAEKLKPLLTSSDQFFLIEGGSHRNLREFDTYHQHLAEVLQ
jgi:alpha-beta hydrolase superfamily lysophospholipase